MDIKKYSTLAELTREARAMERAAFSKMEEAKAEWKRANDELTNRIKVLDGYIAQSKAEDSGVDTNNKSAA